MKAPVESASALLARRSFLKSVGRIAASLPFYALVEDAFAQSVSGALPLKFVGVAGFHGTSEKHWCRQPGETMEMDAPLSAFNFRAFDSPLRPFDEPSRYGYSFKDKLIVFDGFDYGVGYNELASDMKGGASSHGSMALFLTGSAIVDTNYATMNHTLYNASLDQYLAKLYGGQTPFRSVEIATDRLAYQQSGTALSVGESGQILTTALNPAAIFDRFFGNWTPTPGGPQVDPAAAKRRAVGKSILDYAGGDIRRLQGRLANAEKLKLEQHLTALRELEQRIAAQETVVPAMPQCRVPQRHPPTGNANPADNYVLGSGSDSYLNGRKDLDRVANLQMELLTEILICGRTRFATIVLPNSPGEEGLPVPSLAPPGDAGSIMIPSAVGTDIDMQIPANFHNEIAHMYSFDRPEHHRASAAVNRYYHSKVARMMKRLQEAGVLDSTLILVGNEGGTGNHTISNIPIILAGGANGVLRMGRRIVAPGRTPRVAPAALSERIGYQPGHKAPTSHVPILIEVANAFHRAAGQPEINSFGTCAAYPHLIRRIPGLI